MALSPVQRGRRFRELVALVLREGGVETAEARPNRLSDALGAGGDILGVRGWTVNTRAEDPPRLSEGLRATRALAAESGTRAAVVFHRRTTNADESYVVLALDDFASTVKERGNA